METTGNTYPGNWKHLPWNCFQSSGSSKSLSHRLRLGLAFRDAYPFPFPLWWAFWLGRVSSKSHSTSGPSTARTPSSFRGLLAWGLGVAWGPSRSDYSCHLLGLALSKGPARAVRCRRDPGFVSDGNGKDRELHGRPDRGCSHRCSLGRAVPRHRWVRHPVVLYDGIRNLLLVPFLSRVQKINPTPGATAARFVFWYAFLRVFIDLFRDYPTHRLALGTGQTLNLALPPKTSPS